MKKLLQDIGSCTVCVAHLPSGPRPIVAAHKQSKIIVIGQAPGTVVDQTGIPWDDKSGANLGRGCRCLMMFFMIPNKSHYCQWAFVTPEKEQAGIFRQEKNVPRFGMN